MSGSTIGGVVGAVVGSFIPGVGTSIGWMIGSAIGGYVDPDVIKGPRLNDAQVQTASDGVPRPIVYGIAQVAGNIIQRGPLDEHKHRERSGKGGPVQETYTYSRKFAIRVCEGPIAGISRIWADEKPIYDRRDPAQWPEDADAIAAMAADTAKTAAQIAIYVGDESQLPDPTLESLGESYGGGVGNVPAYRGTAYVVFRDWDLTDRQGSIPQFKFEVVSCGTDTPADAARLAKVFSLNGSPSSTTVLESNDGLTWDADVYATHGIATATFTVYRGGLLFVVGLGEGAVSADGGLTWQPMTGLANTATFTAMTATSNAVTGFGLYCLYGGNGTLYTSSNGRTWATQSAAINGASQYCAVGEGTIACGLTNRVVGLSSDGGQTWALHTVTPFGSFSGVTHILAPGNLLAFSNSGGDPCAVSPDGVTWTAGGAYPANINARITAAEMGGGVIVAVDENGHTAHSADGGGSWTAGGSLGGSSVAQTVSNGLVYANGAFILTTAGVIYVSTDNGQTWTNKVTGTVNNHNSLAVIDGSIGTEVPDLPGWVVDSSGTLHGPAQGYVSRCDDMTVAEVVADLCSRVGITADQLELSQLTDQVRGFYVGQQMPCADAARALQQGYFFDFPEWDLKLRGIKRGGASLFTVADADLVESDDDTDTRAQAVEFPRKVNLESPDPYKSYEPVKQTAERRTDNIKAVGELTVQLPITQNANERAQVADKMLKVAWAEAEGKTTFKLPEEFTRVTPSDPFTKDSKRWRVTKKEEADGIVTIEAARDRISAYTSSAVGTPHSSGGAPSGLRGPTRFVAMNLPRLKTADTSLGVYIAACGVLPGWQGCRVYLSVDGGLSETAVRDITTPAILGALTQDFTVGGTSMTVKPTGTLDSVTMAQVSSGLNRFAVTTDYVSEVGQFQTATENEDGTYVLSSLTMGQLGTTAASHYANNWVALLDQAVYFLPLDSSLIGKTLIFRAVTFGTNPENNATFELPFLPSFTTAEDVDLLLDTSGGYLEDVDGGFLLGA